MNTEGINGFNALPVDPATVGTGRPTKTARRGRVAELMAQGIGSTEIVTRIGRECRVGASTVWEDLKVVRANTDETLCNEPRQRSALGARTVAVDRLDERATRSVDPQANGPSATTSDASDLASTPDTWARELARALSDIRRAFGSIGKSTRAPLFEDAAALLTRELTSAPWLVAELMTRGGVTTIGAEPKASKTWLALEISIAIATGTKACGEFLAERGRVAYFFAEDDGRQVRNRIRALLAGRGLPPETIFGRVHVCPRGSFLDITRDEDLALIVASSRVLGKIDLLVLDPLRDIHSGEEDKSDSMRNVMRRLRLLVELLGCTVLVVHHTAKASESTSKRRPGQRLRGSGAIHGSTDNGLYLGDLTGDGRNRFRNVAHSEVKGARSAGRFVLDLAIDDDNQGEAVSATLTASRDETGETVRDARAELVVQIAEVMRDAPDRRRTVRSLRTKPGGGKARIQDALSQMLSDGQIEPVMRGGRHEGYELTPVGVTIANSPPPRAPTEAS